MYDMLLSAFAHSSPSGVKKHGAEARKKIAMACHEGRRPGGEQCLPHVQRSNINVTRRPTLLGDAAVYALANFAVAGVPFLLLPILTRALSPQAYGTVAMFTVVVTLLAVFTGLNLHGALMVRFFEPGRPIALYVTTCLAIVVSATCVVAVVVAGAAPWLERLTTLDPRWLLLACAVAAAQGVVQLLLVLWQATRKPAAYGAFRLAQSLLDAVLSLALVMLLAMSWEGRLVGLTAAWLAAAAVSLVLLHRGGWLTAKVDRASAADALRFGVPLVPHAVGGVLLGIADRFMVTSLLDIGATGIYTVAIQVGLVLGIAADAFNRAFAPWLMDVLRQRDDALERTIVRYTYLYFAGILSVATVGTLCAPFVLPYLAGERYGQAASIAGYVLFGNAFVGMYYMVTNYVFYARRTELLSMLTITAGVVTMGLSWYLISTRGLAGAAQAFMVGQAMMFACTWWLANRCHAMPWGSVFTGRRHRE